MSEVSKFLDSVSHLNDSLRDQITTTTKLEEIVNIANQLGYSFTTKELCAEIQRLTNERRGEIDFIENINLPMHLSEGVAGLDALSSEILALCDQHPAQYPPAI